MNNNNQKRTNHSNNKNRNKNYIEVSGVARFLTEVINSQKILQRVTIRGEISNYKPYTPKGKRTTYFFDLKDKGASLKSISYMNRIFIDSDGNSIYEDGDDVLATGQISYYEKTGYVSFRVSHIEKVGQGSLHQDYLKTKEKLFKEGLFDESRKKEIKQFPNSIGIVTARTSAACADVERTIERRSKFKKMVFFDTIVQGINAPKSIISSLKIADKMDLDVIVMCRGGGSEEDLFCFSEEEVVRQVAAMKTPIVTGIGHEVDTSLSDLASDRRASTPTAAAESVTYVESELVSDIMKTEHNIYSSLKNILQTRNNHFEKDLVSIQKGMSARLQKLHQTCDYYESNLKREVGHRLESLRNSLDRSSSSMKSSVIDGIPIRVGKLMNRCDNLEKILKSEVSHRWSSLKRSLDRSLERLSIERIEGVISGRIEGALSSIRSWENSRSFAFGQKVGQVKRSLDNFDNIFKISNPDIILERGFSLVKNDEGKIIKNINDLKINHNVIINMKDGSANATIKNIKNKEK